MKHLLKPDEEGCGNCDYVIEMPQRGTYEGYCTRSGGPFDHYVNLNSRCDVYLCSHCGGRVLPGDEGWKDAKPAFKKRGG